jgi:hypothetical protein
VDENFKKLFIMGDEMWVYRYDVKLEVAVFTVDDKIIHKTAKKCDNCSFVKGILIIVFFSCCRLMTCKLFFLEAEE